MLILSPYGRDGSVSAILWWRRLVCGSRALGVRLVGKLECRTSHLLRPAACTPTLFVSGGVEVRRLCAWPGWVAYLLQRSTEDTRKELTHGAGTLLVVHDFLERSCLEPHLRPANVSEKETKGYTGGYGGDQRVVLGFMVSRRGGSGGEGAVGLRCGLDQRIR